jgi:hypothetical protein
MQSSIEEKKQALISIQIMIRSNERRLKRLRDAERELKDVLPLQAVREVKAACRTITPAFAESEVISLPLMISGTYLRESQRAIRE